MVMGIGLALAALATAWVWLGLRRLNRAERMPRLATGPRKLVGSVLFIVPTAGIVIGGVYAALALRAALGYNDASNDTGLVLMAAGLLFPAIVLSYLFMAGVYTALYKNSGDFVTVEAYAAAAPNVKPQRYRAFERRFYLVMTGLFFLSSLVFVWGLAR